LSEIGAYEDDMGPLLQLNDRDLDRLLAGHAPSGDGDLDELAAFFREVHSFQALPEAATEARHLSAIMEAVRLRSSTAPAAPQKRRLRGRSWTARVALVAALALGSFCGVAYAGALPGPVQGAVADVARNLGVSLPGAHNDKKDGAQNDKHSGEQSNAPVKTETGSGAVQNNSGDTRSGGNGGTQNKAGHRNANQKSESSTHGSSGAGNNMNDSGSSSAWSSDSSGSVDQVPPGDVGPTPPAGQGDGAQGDSAAQGNGNN
jgi:hypothetical protein